MNKIELIQKKADALITNNNSYLRSLAKEQNYEIRKRVVNNGHCSLDLLEEIAQNEEDAYVLSELSRQEKITERIGFLILKNKKSDEFVRAELSKHIKSENILKILINDKVEYVRFKVITNNNTPLDSLLERLKIEDVEFLKETLKDEINLRLKKLRGSKW